MLPLKRLPFALPKPSASASISIPISSPRTRHFASTPTTQGQNRIYSPVRYPADLATYIATSTSTSKPLLTLWTTSYCAACQSVAPLLHRMVGEERVGEPEGGVLFVEVEFDAPDVMGEGLGLRYMVRSVPMLVGFWRGEVMGGMGGAGGRLGASDIQRLGREGLEEWVRVAAGRGREWRVGHPGGEGLFGGLWRGWGK